MKFLSKFYLPEPDPKNTPVQEPKNSDDKDASNRSEDNTPEKSSLEEALQQWSNDNARDIAEDDADPLKSGL